MKLSHYINQGKEDSEVSIDVSLFFDGNITWYVIKIKFEDVNLILSCAIGNINLALITSKIQNIAANVELTKNEKINYICKLTKEIELTCERVSIIRTT